MGRKCVVPFCKSGYDSCPEKVSMFSVPKNRIEDWQKAIGRTDLLLTPRHTVCEKHFRKKDIIREIKTEIYTYPLLVPKLSEDAIPRIFPKKYEFRPRVRKHPSSIISFMKINSVAIKNMKKRFASTQQQPEVPSRDEFMKKLKEIRERYNKLGSLTKHAYDEIIAELSMATKVIKTTRKAACAKRLKKHYDIIKVDGTKKLVVPNKADKNILIYLHDEEVFDILQNVHISLNHAGAQKMMAELRRNYKNICFKDVVTYISLCPRCLSKKNVKKKIQKIEIKDRKTYCTELSSSCHVHILDYQFNPDGEYKFILVYQNDLTKYHLLRPLKSRSSDDISAQLCDIFAFFGVPATIYSQVEDDLIEDVIEKINLWPDAQIAHLKCENYNNNDVSEYIDKWIEYNGTNKWSDGLRFIQLIINQDYHQDIKKAPYDALFEGPANDLDHNGENVNKFGGNVIKEENVDIFSSICGGCGNDIGNHQTCPMCQN